MLPKVTSVLTMVVLVCPVSKLAGQVSERATRTVGKVSGEGTLVILVPKRTILDGLR